MLSFWPASYKVCKICFFFFYSHSKVLLFYSHHDCHCNQSKISFRLHSVTALNYMEIWKIKILNKVSISKIICKKKICSVYLKTYKYQTLGKLFLFLSLGFSIIQNKIDTETKNTNVLYNAYK